MYFNYPTFLPPWLEENIRKTSDYLDQVGDKLKIDAHNFVNTRVFQQARTMV